MPDSRSFHRHVEDRRHDTGLQLVRDPGPHVITPIARAAHPAAVLQIAFLKGVMRTARANVANAAPCDPSRDSDAACRASCTAHWCRHSTRSFRFVAAAAALRNECS